MWLAAGRLVVEPPPDLEAAIRDHFDLRAQNRFAAAADALRLGLAYGIDAPPELVAAATERLASASMQLGETATVYRLARAVVARRDAPARLRFEADRLAGQAERMDDRFRAAIVRSEAGDESLAPRAVARASLALDLGRHFAAWLEAEYARPPSPSRRRLIERLRRSAAQHSGRAVRLAREVVGGGVEFGEGVFAEVREAEMWLIELGAPGVRTRDERRTLHRRLDDRMPGIVEDYSDYDFSKRSIICRTMIRWCLLRGELDAAESWLRRGLVLAREGSFSHQIAGFRGVVSRYADVEDREGLLGLIDAGPNPGIYERWRRVGKW